MSYRIGELTLKDAIQNKEADGGSNLADIIGTANRMYITRNSLKNVLVCDINPNGIIGGSIKDVSWQSQDEDINKIYRNNTASPTAYTVYTDPRDARDYLIGWSEKSNQIYKWEVNSSANLCNKQIINAPITFSLYGRAGWNGRNSIYFANLGKGSNCEIYRFDIRTQQCTLITSLPSNQNISASYTGSGLFVDDQFVYVGDGSNGGDGLLACFSINGGGFVEKINSSKIKIIAKEVIDNEYGSISFNAYHRVAYYFCYNSSRIIVLPVDGIDFTTRTKLQEVTNLTSLSTPLNAPPSLKEGEKLFVRVSAGVKQGGAYYYGEPRESSLFSAYVNNLPTVPPSIIAPTGAFKVGTKVTVSWGASSDADNQVLSYQLDFNDGKGWYTIVNAQTELTFEHTLPAMSDTTQAKYRVRAFDGKDFCEGYRESGVFTIYNNNAPSNPSAFLIPIAGQKVKPLESITVDWGNSIDADNDKITYTIEFFDGVKWTVIGVGLSDSQIVHMIPKIKGTTRAKYRVKATDGKDWSQYSESNEFEVIAMDLDKLATPNALVFDGKDDEIFLGNPPQLNFSKQITIGFKKIKFNKENYEYPIITKMANVNRPAYAVYATPQGHLKLAFGHSSNTNDVLETTEDFSGRWCIIEAFIDTIKGVMGIKVDGKIVASKLIPKGEDIIQCDSPTEVGYDYTTGKYGSFQLSGLYLFNKNLSDDESDNFRGKDLVGNEAELVGCYPFKDGGGATATDITPYKNNATMRGGIRWSFLFAVLSDLRVPYINNPQKKENLEYLRYQANVFRQANGLAIKKWTDDVLREDITPIKAVHINELQSAIREVYTVMSQFFSNPMTEEELKDEVLAHSKKYDIKKLPNRINTILRGLENK